MADLAEVDFEKGDGLVPCVTQDALTGRVLMLAYMDDEALERTIETGEMHYFSRSRDELWRKGETSGNTQRLVGLGLDCDGDTVLALVDPAGPACHTGEQTCFFTPIGSETASRPGSGARRALEPILVELWEVVDDRARELPEDSWTTRLLTEGDLVEEKVLEEAREVVDRAREADGAGGDPLEHEIADLWYHTLVLARKHGVTLDDVLGELDERRD